LAQASSTSLLPNDPIARKKVVVFDSSFLIAVMQRPTTWKEDITEKVGAFLPVVLDSVFRELTTLAKTGDKKGRFAGLALELISRGDFTLKRDGGGRPDDEITSFALREGAAVATLDSDLAQRLRASRVRTIITLSGGRVST
jgi:rRNA-processing protein FCF1